MKDAFKNDLITGQEFVVIFFDIHPANRPTSTYTRTRADTHIEQSRNRKKHVIRRNWRDFFCLFFFFISFFFFFFFFHHVAVLRCECAYRVSVYMHYKNNNKRVKSSSEELLTAVSDEKIYIRRISFSLSLSLCRSRLLTCRRKRGRFRQRFDDDRCFYPRDISFISGVVFFSLSLSLFLLR